MVLSGPADEILKGRAMRSVEGAIRGRAEMLLEEADCDPVFQPVKYKDLGFASRVNLADSAAGLVVDTFFPVACISVGLSVPLTSCLVRSLSFSSLAMLIVVYARPRIRKVTGGELRAS